MDITIKKLYSKADAPMDLLLLADPSEELVNSYLDKGICYTAEIDGETVGVVLVMETKAQTMEVMNLAVKEELHNKGIGKQLLLYVIEEIKKSDIKTIEIGTGNPGVVQMLLYQKCGFRIVGIDFDFFRRTHPERIYENGIECRDMIRMRIEL
ncbi:MAG: GNAT family N-acetyltransferase [Spirochaetales bacterium]|nr:GNAT family N-acetyltransferase [Spirochaetales bacterium]